MGETGEKQSDITLLFKLKNPDGSYDEAYTPKGEKVIKIHRLTPEEVRRMKGIGYEVEPVEPDPTVTFIEKSQTTYDKEN